MESIFGGILGLIPVFLLFIAIGSRSKNAKNEATGSYEKNKSNTSKKNGAGWAAYDDNWKKMKETLENRLQEAERTLTNPNQNFATPMKKVPKDQPNPWQEKKSTRKGFAKSSTQNKQHPSKGIQVYGETQATRDAQSSFDALHQKEVEEWKRAQAAINKTNRDFQLHIKAQHAMQKRMVQESQNLNR